MLGKVTIPSPPNTVEWGGNSPDDKRLILTFQREDSKFKKKAMKKLRIKDHKIMAGIGITERDQALTVSSNNRNGEH